DGEYVLDSDGNRIGVYEDVLDDGPILQAVDRLIKIGESRRKLLGSDAATKMDVSGTVTSRIIGVPDDGLRPGRRRRAPWGRQGPVPGPRERGPPGRARWA